LAPRGTEFTLFHRRKNLVVQNTNFYFSLDTLWGGENNTTRPCEFNRITHKVPKDKFNLV